MFCGIVAGDVPSVKVAEDETTCAFMDINPASDGHLLVVPKRHSKDLFTPVTTTTRSTRACSSTPRGAGGCRSAPSGAVSG